MDTVGRGDCVSKQSLHPDRSVGCHNSILHTDIAKGGNNLMIGD